MEDQTKQRIDGMPVIGLGSWQLTRDTARLVAEALKIGYRLIDTSGDYGTQSGVGEGIRASGVRREDIYVTTKVEESDDAYEAVVRNLGELGLEYADLVLIHRPPATGAGQTHWEGLRRAKAEGLCHHVGVSNYPIELIVELVDSSGEVPLVNQIEWTPFGHSEDMYAFCRQNAIIIQAYSPLARGEKLNDPTIKQIGRAYGKSPAQVMLRWDLQLGVVPLPKASSIEHMRENFDVFDFELSDDDMATLNGLNEGYSAFGRLPY